MPIQANATRLKSRLNDITNALRLAPYALSTVAIDTIADVSSNAVTGLAGREDQVGFDLPQFLSNISSPGSLQVNGGQGSVGILDQDIMGTLADFDAISSDPELWHQFTGSAELFRMEVFENPEVREDLARARQRVWGGKTPQWYLMEYGYSGGDAYPPVPAEHFISRATRADRMALRLYNAMNSLFRGLPRR